MAYQLYYSPGSSNLVVRMVLEELEVDYSDIRVARSRADRGEEFHKLSPRGLVPVLVDDQLGISIFETAAIVLYLADQQNKLAPSPARPQGRAACLKWLFMLSNTVHADLNMRFYAEQYVDTVTSRTIYFEKNKERFMHSLRAIDSAFQDHSSPTLLETGLSICDFYLGCLLRWAQLYPKENTAMAMDSLDAFPRVALALLHLQERPSVRRAMTREGLDGPAFLNPVPSKS